MPRVLIGATAALAKLGLLCGLALLLPGHPRWLATVALVALAALGAVAVLVAAMALASYFKSKQNR